MSDFENKKMLNILSLFNHLWAGYPLLSVQSVGVGSMQMAHIYQEDNQKWIRIVYDCGSISSGSNVKIAQLSKVDQSDAFLRYISQEYRIFEAELRRNPTCCLDTPSKTHATPIQTDTPDSAFSMQNGHVIQPDLKDQIVEKVSNITDGVDQVLLIISHLDADHYNLLENITKDYEKITIIVGSDPAHKKSKEHLFNLPIFKKARVSIPYLWKAGSNTYQHVLHNLQTDYATLFCRSYPNTEPTFQNFTGDLEDFKKVEERLGSQDFLGGLSENTLKKLFFLHLNSPSLTDVNAQSIICALTIPEVQTAAFFTGDIEPKTVDYMKNNSTNYEKFYNTIKNYYRTVIGWHHGSKNNCTTTMLNFFKPDMMILPAGMGQRFHHPHHHVRQVVSEWMQKRPTSTFSGTFDPQHNTAYTLFFKDNKQPCIYPYSQDCPILSTSLSGTLWLTQKGWHQENSPNITIDGPNYTRYYTIDISQHVDTLDLPKDWQPGTSLRYNDKTFDHLSDDHRLIFHNSDKEAIYVVQVERQNQPCAYYVYPCELIGEKTKNPIHPSPDHLVRTNSEDSCSRALFDDNNMDIDEEPTSILARALFQDFKKNLCLTPNNKCPTASSPLPSPSLSPAKKRLSPDYVNGPQHDSSPTKRIRPNSLNTRA